jgi:hypothetical protein
VVCFCISSFYKKLYLNLCLQSRISCPDLDIGSAGSISLCNKTLKQRFKKGWIISLAKEGWTIGRESEGKSGKKN